MAVSKSLNLRLCRAALLIVVLVQGGPALPQVRTDQAKTPLQEVVVTAKRHLTDEQVTQQVEKALEDDPYVYAEHVTVTTRRGVVTCEGIVGDAAELRHVLGICRRASGAKRVVSELQINDYPPEGG
jgi:osmotically-inducible protein OsmY